MVRGQIVQIQRPQQQPMTSNVLQLPQNPLPQIQGQPQRNVMPRLQAPVPQQQQQSMQPTQQISRQQPLSQLQQIQPQQQPQVHTVKKFNNLKLDFLNNIPVVHNSYMIYARAAGH